MAMTARMRLLPAAGVAVATGIVLSFLGVQTVFAWAWGVLAAAAVLAFGAAMPDDPRADAPRIESDDSAHGSHVSRLAWAIDARQDRVGQAVSRRVRALLRRRLAPLHLDPDDPAHVAAVDVRLGAGLWSRLSGSHTRITDIEDALAAAERLAPEETR